MSYRGLTWDHPRGYNALAAAQAAGGPVHWEVQPLEGFESAPIADLCARYDLVVLDHPHLGEAVATNCLRPLDDLLPADRLAAIARDSIGPVFASYAMAGRQWALPLDAATQVMALRPDLVATVPATWAGVADMAAGGGVALSLAGPHAFLSLLSVCAALDPALDMADGGWPDQGTLSDAFTLLALIAAFSVHSVRALNPIGILDHMLCHDDVALVPLIYGYVNYSTPDLENRIAFHDAPRIAGRPGSILGGTGIAVSSRVEVNAALSDHLLWLLGREAQCGFIPAHDGQPAHAAAWHDPTINSACGGFFAQTVETLQAAAIRPRHDGYIAFQAAASALVRRALDDGAAAAPTARAISDLFARSLDGRKGPFR
ncbi:carbohydrate ABC transporter substrate-binding protein [Tropicimonas sp.]|uniref:carbohydrate ABC transporter substrate-binding protein n=1 Tax=Tropicimonas sp. TaxID=2067044 RepID=UPI003A889340